MRVVAVHFERRHLEGNLKNHGTLWDFEPYPRCISAKSASCISAKRCKNIGTYQEHTLVTSYSNIMPYICCRSMKILCNFKKRSCHPNPSRPKTCQTVPVEELARLLCKRDAPDLMGLLQVTEKDSGSPPSSH